MIPLLISAFIIPVIAHAGIGCERLNEILWKKELDRLEELRTHHKEISTIVNLENSVLNMIQREAKDYCDSRADQTKTLQEEFKPLTQSESNHCETLVNRVSLLERTISSRASQVKKWQSFLEKTKLRQGAGLKQSNILLKTVKNQPTKEKQISLELNKIWSDAGSGFGKIASESIRAITEEKNHGCSAIRADANNALELMAKLVASCGASDKGYYRGAINTSLEACNIPPLALPNSKDKKTLCQFHRETGRIFQLNSFQPSERIAAFKKFNEDKKANKYESRPCTR